MKANSKATVINTILDNIGMSRPRYRRRKAFMSRAELIAVNSFIATAKRVHNKEEATAKAGGM